MRLRCLLFALALSAHAAPGLSQVRAAHPASEERVGQSAWLLDYQGKSANELIWDRRTKRLVQTRVPSALSGKVLSGLGGPPNPVFVVADRYVSTSACRAHSCIEKGFLWVDTHTGIGLGAYYLDGKLLLGSNGMSHDRIPRPAMRAVNSWLEESDLRATSVAFLAGSGERSTLDAGEFNAAQSYQAPAGGPAFDCSRSLNAIEAAICADEGLSAQDLALSKLYRSIRQGIGTATAQEQLRDLQRSWLRDRNRGCSDAGNVVSCLQAKYEAQYQRLRNWGPTVGRSN